VTFLRIILLGAPGVGKGTQAKLISEHFKIPHISTGDIFRSNINEMTPLGIQAKDYIQRGQLVPDSLTIAIVRDRLKKEDCENGFLLDGFPRNIYQAKELDSMLADQNVYIDKVFNIYIPEQLILERITGRRFCTACGSSYHISFNPAKEEGKCDSCGADLIQRSDDKEEIIKDRLAVYHKSTRPLIDYYNSAGTLYNIQGDSDIKDVFQSISLKLQAV
jgi:adenylate kinase